MGIWEALVIIVAIVVVAGFVLRVVKMGIRYSENVERIKHGYPTIDGAKPLKPGAADDEGDSGDKYGQYN
jgi:hypothetical protein